MVHWQMIAIAYSLTFAALAVEVSLLFRRRCAARRQALASSAAGDAADAGDAGKAS